MSQTQKLASALVSVHRMMTDEPTPGKRLLFDAVNEAFVHSYVAPVLPLVRQMDRFENNLRETVSGVRAF